MRRFWMIFLAGLLAVLGGCWSSAWAAQQAVEMVVDGKSHAVIVTSANLSQPLQRGVDDLLRYIAQREARSGRNS